MAQRFLSHNLIFDYVPTYALNHHDCYIEIIFLFGVFNHIFPPSSLPSPGRGPIQRQRHDVRPIPRAGVRLLGVAGHGLARQVHLRHVRLADAGGTRGHEQVQVNASPPPERKPPISLVVFVFCS